MVFLKARWDVFDEPDFEYDNNESDTEVNSESNELDLYHNNDGQVSDDELSQREQFK